MAEITQMSVKELQEKIKKLKDLGETDAVAKYEAELSKRQGKSSSSSDSGGITADEWGKAGSKFPKEGLHESEFFAAEWKTVNGSVNLHFVISEDGDDNGKEGDIVAGIGKNAIWKFKEICQALGVDPVFKNGVLDVAGMFGKFAGKKGMVQFVKQQDTRAPEEGGKGGFYVKPVTVLPLGSVVEEIL